jgi:membrane protein required for colicin V production
MVLNVAFFISLAFAAWKGFNKGLIVMLFGFIASILGAVGALKLSHHVAAYLQANHSVSGTWVPALAFTITFVGIVFVIKMAANLIQKLTETLLLGWLNKLGGVLVSMLMVTVFYSLFVWLLQKGGIISLVQQKESGLLSFLLYLGPNVIEVGSKLVPYCSTVIQDLNSFFVKVDTSLPSALPQ